MCCQPIESDAAAGCVEVAGDHVKRAALHRRLRGRFRRSPPERGVAIETDCSCHRRLDVHFVIRMPDLAALDKSRGLWDLAEVVTEDHLTRAIPTWMLVMPFPFAETVSLTDVQRAQLETLVRAGSTPQALVFRCRLILRAAEKDHPTNLQIAVEFHCDRHTVALWRNRYLEKGLAGLQDAPRSGRPRRFSPLGTARGDQFGEQHDRPTGLSRHPVGAR